jgi:hypothetical protein
MALLSSVTVLRLVDSMAILLSQAYQLARARLASSASPVVRLLVQRDQAFTEVDLLRRDVEVFRAQREGLPPHRGSTHELRRCPARHLGRRSVGPELPSRCRTDHLDNQMGRYRRNERPMMRMRTKALAVVLAATISSLTTGVFAGPPVSAMPARPAPAGGAPATITVLELGKPFGADNMKQPGTIWRYFETIQTDLCRTASGELVRVDPLDCLAKESDTGQWVSARGELYTTRPRSAKYRLNPARETRGTPYPPDNWREVDFDDAGWVRYTSPGGVYDRFAFDIERYRSLALVCLRGRFEVADPAQVAELGLTLVIRGGAVVYLNGREAGRAFMPEGKILPDSLAHDYPKEAYLYPDGTLLPSAEQAVRRLEEESAKRRCASRLRTVELKIAPALLRKGVNVLAVEAHRAPAIEELFTGNTKQPASTLEVLRAGGWHEYTPGVWWDRVAVGGIRLTAVAPPGAVAPNCQPPGGMKTWSHPVTLSVNPYYYGDPHESPGAIDLVGARNGAYAGEVVVGSDEPLRGLKIVVTGLKGPGGGIPASAIEVGHARYTDSMYQFDGLEAVAPQEVKKVQDERQRAMRVVQPVWVTVSVPGNAATGKYRGTLTISAEGQTPVDVPVRLNVIGNWVVPDPKTFVTYMAIMQSPESVSMQYDVPMWSEAHWRHLDTTFRLLGRIGTSEIHIPTTSGL